jgi:hypothetical protein
MTSSGSRSRRRGIRKEVVRALNRVVSPLETLGGRADAPLAHRPIFVVGPPRSGTTLLVQVIDVAFDVRFFTNLLNACWGAPSVVARLCRPFTREARVEFSSDLGSTSSWLGFSEAPNYWLRFFPERPHCLSAGDVSPEALARLRIAVGRLVRGLGRPTVFKTIVNTGRLEPLATALPEALFLVSRRTPLEIGHSILEARRRRYGSFEPWLSIEPPGIEQLKEQPLHEQVIEQALRTYAWIDREAERIGRQRFLDVDYEELCADPHASMERIGAFAGLPRRDRSSWARIPARFERRSQVRIPPELFERMASYREAR